MKIKPEIFLNNKGVTGYKKILITGSDETYINHVTEYVVGCFREKKYYIDESGEINNNLSGNLFSDKKVLFLLKDFSTKNEIFKEFDNFDNSLLISSLNSKKTSAIKLLFSKSKTDVLVECYSMNRESKQSVLRDFIDVNNLKLSSDVYWYIIDAFDNQYALFVKQLEMLSLYGGGFMTIKDVDVVVFTEKKIEINKLFFFFFKSNMELIKIFRQNIYSINDFYFLLGSLKFYLDIIGGSKSKSDALTKLPRYLFNEKDLFIKIYNSLNQKKLVELYKNISKAEILLRQNSGLYYSLGVRFLLNTKKIITS